MEITTHGKRPSKIVLNPVLAGIHQMSPPFLAKA
jgi:hypothetical protein